MPDPIPEEADTRMSADDLEEAFKNVRFRFWTCLNKAHRYVTWNGDVASCDTCGLTSEMTAKRDSLVREHERRKVAGRIAAAIEAVDPVEWALAGQHAGHDAARIARQIGEGE